MNYVRDLVEFPVPDDYFKRRQSEGWTLKVIEWERDAPSSAPVHAGESVPYGLEVVSGSLRLAQNANEMEVLLTVLKMIVKDQSVPSIADELNRRSFKNRAGEDWTASAVFELLPRVIEMGPILLKSPAWLVMRSTANGK